MEVLNGLVHEAKRNKFSGIGPILSEDDVLSVWENVSTFIERQMAQQKGVHIQGLGTFTFTQKKLDVGNNKFILIQRPVFLLSEKVAQTHQLHYTKHHVTGQIPVVQLNFSCLSFESPYDRDTVETCVKEVLQALARSIESKKNVEFTFHGIGRLQIRDAKVKMKFYKEFLSTMDGTGQLAKALKTQACSESVLSSCSEQLPNCAILNIDKTPAKICSLVLPKINSSLGGASGFVNEDRRATPEVLPTIVEDGGGDDVKKNECDYDDTPTAGGEGTTNTDAPGSYTVEASVTDSGVDHFLLPPAAPPARDGSRMAREAPRMSAPTSKVTGYNDDILTCPLSSAKGARLSTSTMVEPPGTPISMMKRSLTPLCMQQPSPPQTPLSRQATPGPRKLLTHPGLGGDEVCLKKPSMLLKMPATPPILKKHRKTPVVTSDDNGNCGHSDAGQELCYLCHQRNKRNIPVYFAEERKCHEDEADRLLQQYQHIKDTDLICKDQESMLAKRHESQKIAGFNLGASEALKYKRQARETDFHSSYVFQNRPVTPPKYLKQEKYFDDLNEQVGLKNEKLKMRKADADLLERLEQVQLAEDLALQREEFLRDKAETTENYKRALSAQILVRDVLKTPNSQHKIRGNRQMTPPTLPKPQIILPFSEMIAIKVLDGSKVVRYKQLPLFMSSAEPVFGKNDMNAEKMLDRRRCARTVYQEQINTVENRKRDSILNRINNQSEEENTLEKCRDELLKDRADRYQQVYKNRRSLEEDWRNAIESKIQRESDDRMRFQSPALLVHQQCDKYKRCGQCKRKVNNGGESNIWRESRYIPGSRLMV